MYDPKSLLDWENASVPDDEDQFCDVCGLVCKETYYRHILVGQKICRDCYLEYEKEIMFDLEERGLSHEEIVKRMAL